MTTSSHTDSRAAGASLPRMFGQRDYLLPDTVHTNIPRQHYEGAPGMWAYARGLLVETCRVLPATPVGLFYRVCTDSVGNTAAVVVTAIARDDNNDIVTVIWRQEHGMAEAGPIGWQLTIDGAVPHNGSGRVRPSPPILATIISRTVNG